jgi:hypothetical protein
MQPARCMKAFHQIVNTTSREYRKHQHANEQV